MKQAPENQSSLGKKQQEQRAHWPDLVCTPSPRRGSGSRRVPVWEPGPSARWVCGVSNSASVPSHSPEMTHCPARPAAVSSHLCPALYHKRQERVSHHGSLPGEPFSLPSFQNYYTEKAASSQVRSTSSLCPHGCLSLGACVSID